MKKTLLAFCLASLCLTYCLGQQNNAVPRDIIQKARVLQTRLTLNEKQTAELMTIFTEASKQLQKIINSEHGQTDKILARLAPLKAETIKNILHLLTPAQAVKFKILLKQLGTPAGDQWTPDRPRPAGQ